MSPSENFLFGVLVGIHMTLAGTFAYWRIAVMEKNENRKMLCLTATLIVMIFVAVGGGIGIIPFLIRKYLLT